MSDWYDRCIRSRFSLHGRLAYMAVVKNGDDRDCPHRALRCGFLEDDDSFISCGDDVLCLHCGQVWAATEDSDYYRLTGHAPFAR